MGQNSAIEWTEATWNPLTGCDKISPGCSHCYAERMSLRLRLMGQRNYRNGFDLTLHPHALELPLKWKKPQRIFVNSMSDLFHKDVPADFIQQVFATMRQASWHRFQILTKRSDRLAEERGVVRAPWVLDHQPLPGLLEIEPAAGLRVARRAEPPWRAGRRVALADVGYLHRLRV